MWRGFGQPSVQFDTSFFVNIVWPCTLYLFIVVCCFFFLQCENKLNWIELVGFASSMFNRRALYTAVEQHIEWLHSQLGALCYHFLHIEISLIVSSISLRLNGFGFLEAWTVKMYRNVFPIMSDRAQVSVLWQHCTGEPRENAPSIPLYLIKHSSQISPPNYKQIYSTGISVIFHI